MLYSIIRIAQQVSPCLPDACNLYDTPCEFSHLLWLKGAREVNEGYFGVVDELWLLCYENIEPWGYS